MNKASNIHLKFRHAKCKLPELKTGIDTRGRENTIYSMPTANNKKPYMNCVCVCV